MSEKPMKLILGSGSPRRREILTMMGISFEVRVSDCEEKITSTIPNEIVASISKQKCDSFGALNDDELLLTADTIVELDGRILGKPHSYEEAFEMLRFISGKRHKVLTSVCLRSNDYFKNFTDVAYVDVKELTDEDIKWYIETGDAMDKAGAYGIQGPFKKFIPSFEGDFYTIMGLPKVKLEEELKRFDLK